MMLLIINTWAPQPWQNTETENPDYVYPLGFVSFILRDFTMLTPYLGCATLSAALLAQRPLFSHDLGLAPALHRSARFWSHRKVKEGFEPTCKALVILGAASETHGVGWPAGAPEPKEELRFTPTMVGLPLEPCLVNPDFEVLYWDSLMLSDFL